MKNQIDLKRFEELTQKVNEMQKNKKSNEYLVDRAKVVQKQKEKGGIER